MPGEQLCQAYEELRAQATGRAGPEVPMARGLALLLRSGMAGWMQAWRGLAVSPTTPPPPPTDGLQPRAGLTAEVAVILAQMALQVQGAGNLLRESTA
jgi:hypothetical protein